MCQRVLPAHCSGFAMRVEKGVFMKKIAIMSISFLLAAVLLIGCKNDVKKTEDSTGVSQTAESSAAEEQKAEFSIGTIDGATYSSDFNGLTFTAPEGWTYASNEEIANLMGSTAEEMFDGDKLSQKALESQSLYDMMVMNQATGSNVIIFYEDLSKAIGGTKVTEEDYMDITKKGLEQQKPGTYEQMGESTKQKLGEQEYYTSSFTLKDEEGMEQHYYLRRIDNYMSGLIITTVQEDVADIIKSFS